MTEWQRREMLADQTEPLTATREPSDFFPVSTRFGSVAGGTPDLWQFERQATNRNVLGGLRATAPSCREMCK
jgi:hypothetical protein